MPWVREREFWVEGMNVILMMLAILYSDHCEFGGEKTECQGAEEGGALDSWAGPWPPLAAAG